MQFGAGKLDIGYLIRNCEGESRGIFLNNNCFLPDVTVKLHLSILEERKNKIDSSKDRNSKP